jgi:dolichol kinase
VYVISPNVIYPIRDGYQLVLWFMSIILAIWEAEIRMISVQEQPGKKATDLISTNKILA